MAVSDSENLLQSSGQEEITGRGYHEREGRSILCQTVHCTGFPSHAFDEHTNGHAAREGMRIDNNIGLYPALAKGHVDGWPFLRADAFLSVSRREFVTDHRRTGNPERDMNFL